MCGWASVSRAECEREQRLGAHTRTYVSVGVTAVQFVAIIQINGLVYEQINELVFEQGRTSERNRHTVAGTAETGGYTQTDRLTDRPG